MTLNGVMAVTLRYFTEFCKPALQKTICGGIYAIVCCIFSACTTSLQRKFTFAISSPDEFLVCFLQRAHRSHFLTDRDDLYAETRVSGHECAFWGSRQYMTTFIGSNFQNGRKLPFRGQIGEEIQVYIKSRH